MRLAHFTFFAACAVFVVSGCGGGSAGITADNVAEVRAVNGFQGITSADLKTGNIVAAFGISNWAASTYAGVTSGSQSLSFVDSILGGSPLASLTSTLAKGSSSTIIGYGISGNRKVLVVNDDRTAAPAGTALVRWVNAISTQGDVDAYITVPNVSLMGLSPEPLTIGPGNQVSGYTSLTPGTYQIRVFPFAVSLGTPLVNTTIVLADGDRKTILLLDPQTVGGPKQAIILDTLQ